ncbi:MSC_0624 family F1-like ATPase-associated membrane protein [Mycoplasma leonicaptivi]|uniref:MSC_0624 family F1-like ATPase-associated membrane protein n=1 Tax=Mycoplasma leonicaptivi TaxID=36742 RepID=UPI0004838D37|nr:hypothetical protein [Mycoplasma leonicaptivi]
MNSTLIEDKKIYDDYSSSLSFRSKNKWVFIYKAVLISFFVLAIFALFLFIDKSLFDSKLLLFSEKQPLGNFLLFDTYTNQQVNAVVLIRFSILFFVFLFSVFKNYKNINTQKEKIVNYIYFYVLYFLISITSFVLFFSFTEPDINKNYDPKPYLNLIYILIPLLIIDLAFEINNYIYKRKSEPILYSSVIPLVIQLISKIVLVLFAIVNTVVWVSYTDQYLFDYIKDENQLYWKTIENLFVEKSVTNLIIIIVATLILSFSIVGANINRFIKNVETGISQVKTKDKYFLNIIIIVGILVLFLKSFISSKSIESILFESGSDKFEIISLLFLFVGLAVTVAYFGLNYFLNKITKNSKDENKNTIIFTISQSLLWLQLVLAIFIIDNEPTKLYFVFILSVFSTLIYLHYIIKSWNISKINSILLMISLFVKSILLFIFGLNNLLLADNNYILISVPTPISLIKIFVLVNFAVLVLFLIFSVLNIQIKMIKHFSHVKKDIKGVK